MYISCHPQGDDVPSKEMHFKNREGLLANLKPWRDLSAPFKAHFGLVLDLYEQESSLDLYTGWDDTLRSYSNIKQLMTDFAHNLDRLVGGLWPGKGPKWAYQAHNRGSILLIAVKAMNEQGHTVTLSKEHG